MKHLFYSYVRGWMWHISHALAVLLLILVLFERFVPGAVLGHGSLFLAVPLLVVCLTVHPLAEKPARPWLLIDLWLIVALCLGRIFLQLADGTALAWLLAGFASALVLAFLWIFSHVSEESTSQGV